MVNVEGAGQPGGGVAVLNPELAAGAVAIGIHRGFRHAQLAGDLLGGQMLVHQPQAFALPRCEQTHRIFSDDVPCAHDDSS
jgi:hypothetical protein